MERAFDERKQELYDKGIEISSISRVDTINQCKYQAYKTYIEKAPRTGNVYSSLGGKTHDVLEGITNGTHTEEDLLPSIMSELEDLDLLGLEFPKDRQGNDTIKQSWITDMVHFATTYKAPKGKNLIAEEGFLFKTPKGHYMQGYIDLQHVRKDGSIDIYDYKTSSMYTGSAIKEHQRQLIIYAMAKEQDGVKVNSSSWIFLKYADVVFEGYKTSKSKKKSTITKTIERRKIGITMQPYVERDLIDSGFDDLEIETMIEELIKTNKFDHLPENIRSNYKIMPCVKKATLTDETKQECIDYIESTMAEWESLGDDVKNYPPKSFTRTQANGRVVSDTFFCVNLCDHYKNCPYIAEYLEQTQGQNEEDDLF